MRFKEYEFQVRKAQVERYVSNAIYSPYLRNHNSLLTLCKIPSVGYDAFLQVLSKKQTNHLEVVDWLRGQSRKMGPKSV